MGHYDDEYDRMEENKQRLFRERCTRILQELDNFRYSADILEIPERFLYSIEDLRNWLIVNSK